MYIGRTDINCESPTSRSVKWRFNPYSIRERERETSLNKLSWDKIWFQKYTRVQLGLPGGKRRRRRQRTSWRRYKTCFLNWAISFDGCGTLCRFIAGAVSLRGIHNDDGTTTTKRKRENESRLPKVARIVNRRHKSSERGEVEGWREGAISHSSASNRWPLFSRAGFAFIAFNAPFVAPRGLAIYALLLLQSQLLLPMPLLVVHRKRKETESSYSEKLTLKSDFSKSCKRTNK